MYLDPNHLNAFNALPLEGGGVRVLVTVIQGLSMNCPFVTILDLDAQGEETRRFTVNFGDSPLGHVSISDAVLLPSGSILLSGTISQWPVCPTSDGPVFAALADTDGNITWFTNPGNGGSSQKSVALQDGKMVIWSYLSSDGAALNYLWRRMLLAPDGSLLSSTVVAVPALLINGSLTAATATPDGGLASASVVTKDPDGDPALGYTLTVFKLDQAGAVEWSSSLDTDVGCYQVKANADGTFLIGGQIPFWSPFYGTKVSIIKFDAMGHPLWSSYFENSELVTILFDFGEASGGGALYQGMQRLDTTQDDMIATLTELGTTQASGTQEVGMRVRLHGANVKQVAESELEAAVVIFSAPDFDVRVINQATVTLDGVAAIPDKRSKETFKDINRDGLPDLVLRFRGLPGGPKEIGAPFHLSGFTYRGLGIHGNCVASP